jgi:hypothetical protein
MPLATSGAMAGAELWDIWGGLTGTHVISGTEFHGVLKATEGFRLLLRMRHAIELHAHKRKDVHKQR